MSSVRIVMLASAVAVATTAAVAEPPGAARDNSAAALFSGRTAISNHHKGWYRASIFHRRDGYLPDHRLCFPGACRDNPYY